MNIDIAGTIDVSTLPILPLSPDQIVRDVEETLSEIRRIGDQLNDISKEGLEGVVRSLLLLILGGGLADYGLDLGIKLPLSDLMGLKGELVDWLIETTTPWLDGVFEDVKDTLATANIPIDTATLQQAYKSFVDWFTQGKAVAKSPTAVRHPASRADPVELGRGEFIRKVVDTKLQGAGMDFSLVRRYRSGVGFLGSLGPSWDHSANQRLREESPFVIARVTGMLSEQRFIRHPRFGADPFNYYAPPDGVHDVLVPDQAGSFQLLRPRGYVQSFEPAPGPAEHRLHRVEDRFGNYLQFVYNDDDQLARIFVNSQQRFLDFNYDSSHLVGVIDHAGRAVEYRYDDTDYLAAALGPANPGNAPAHVEEYEYDAVGLVRKLTRVYDWEGRILAENEYDDDPGSPSAGWLTRQIVNRGESTFFYESMTDAADPTLPVADVAVLKVWESRRNGHQLVHWLNRLGNELRLEEQLVDGSQVRRRVTSLRYNADGQVIAKVDPEGVATQYLYGREDVADSIPWPEFSHVLGNVPMLDRMSFGNLLSVVVRGRRFDPLMIDLAGGGLPAVKQRDHPDDTILKYRYSRDGQLLLSSSDPRFTRSPDPRDVESAAPGDPAYDPNDPAYQAYQRVLTRMEYGPGPRYELRRQLYPDRTRPSPLDGVGVVTGILESYPAYDASGRLLERIDPGGYHWYNEYYPADADPTNGAKEGFPRRRLAPHFEIDLDSRTLDILEIRRQGGWIATDRFFQSGGVQGDALLLQIEGCRITLAQSTDAQEIASRNDRVAIVADGVNLPVWNQALAAQYVIDNLSAGIHTIRVEDMVGSPIAVGHVSSHVARSFDVNVLGQVLRETDPCGFTIIYELDVLGQILKVTRGPAANPSVIETEYDGLDRVIRQRRLWRDGAGVERPERAVIKEFQYDQSGMVLTTSVGPELGGSARMTRQFFDPEDRCTVALDPRGNPTYFDYDEVNRKIRTIRAACSPDRSVNSIAYDLADRVLGRVNPRGALNYNGYQDAAGQWHSSLDTHGRPRVRTDPLGNLTVTDFDALDHPLVVRLFQCRPTGRFELLVRSQTDYDELGAPVRLTTPVFDDPIPTADPINAPDGEFLVAGVASSVTELHRNARGNIVATRYADGGIDRRRFDGQGRMCESSNPEGVRVLRLYNGNGNTVRIYRFDPRHDGANNVIGYEAFVELHDYDELGRELVLVDSYGNRWRNEYDSLDNRTRTIDPLGNVIRSDFSAFGEEVSRSEERTSTGIGGDAALAPLVTDRTYDPSGNLIALTDPAGRRSVFTYNALDRPISWRFDVGAGEPSEIRAYDPAGNLIIRQARNGLIQTMTYDLADRRVRTTIDTAALPPADPLSPLTATWEVFRYDGAGRLVRHANNFASVRIWRDSRGLARRERVSIRGIPAPPPPQELVRRYDLVGRRSGLVYPSGRELKYASDLSGRLTLIQNVGAPADYPGKPANRAGFDLMRYSYHGNRLVSAAMGNRLTATRSYDGCGRALEHRVTQDNGNVDWRNQVLRDAAGITRIETSMIRGGERSRKFALDSLYRLVLYQDGAANWVDPTALSPPASPVDPVAAGGQGILNAAIGDLSLPADQAVYEYDDTGNRVATREPGTPPFDCVSDALNQYTDVGGVPWHYDASGNLRSDGIWTFLYDLHDALSIVANARTGVRQASYYRDALGRVVAEVTPANTVFRISDGNIALVEMDARSRTEYTTQPIDEMVVHVASGGEDYWITRDKRGSLRLLTDSQGHLVAIPSYRPYGTAEDGELGFSPLRLAFGAMWFTPGLPFLHTRSRAYRTDLGRFLQRDPLGQAGGLNLYVYGGNNPVDRWDPSGLQDELDDLVDLQLSPVSLQYPSSSPLSLSTDPNEFRLQLIGDRTDLTDFQKDLMLSRAAQDVTGNVAARLTEDVFSADKIKAGLLVNLLGPPLVAGLLANPLGSIIDFTVGEMVKSGTKSALDSLGVDEQTSEWIATGAQLLSGPLVNAAVGKAAQALINAQVGAEFENYVEATVLAEYDEAQLLESQRSFATPFFEAIKWRVRPDWNIFNEDYQLAWIADAKTSDFIPFDLQAEAFVDIAASTTTKTLVYFVPGAATADILDKKLLEYALEAKVTLKVIQVP